MKEYFVGNICIDDPDLKKAVSKQQKKESDGGLHKYEDINDYMVIICYCVFSFWKNKNNYRQVL